MTEQHRRLSIGFVLLVVVLGVVMFVVPSSFVASRGAPWWLCMTVGALAFPVLPVVWQLAGERRRRKRLAATKTPNKAVLTSGDRFVIRCLVVGAVAIGPVFALDGRSAVTTVWHNVGWVIPVTPWPGHADAPALSHVPADAELVVSIHKDADVKAHEDAVDAVVGYANGRLMFHGTGDHVDRSVSEINDELDRLPIKIDHLVEISTDFFASSSWKSAVDTATGPTPDIRALLGKAPANAMVAMAGVPKTAAELKMVKSVTGWLVATDDALTIDIQLEAVDPTQAGLALTMARGLWNAQHAKLSEECRDNLDKIVDKARCRSDRLDHPRVGSGPDVGSVRCDAVPQGQLTVTPCVRTTATRRGCSRSRSPSRSWLEPHRQRRGAPDRSRRRRAMGNRPARSRSCWRPLWASSSRRARLHSGR